MTTLVPYGMRLGAHTDGVASTIARIDAKFPQCVCKEEQHRGEANGFNFELFTGECKGHAPCLGATRAGDTMVYAEEDAPETLRMREGCAGGGKGPLLSKNVSLTLATSNDQALLEKRGAKWWDGSEKADTLTCKSDAQRMPDKGRLQCVVDMRQLEAETDGCVSPTLLSTDYKGGKAVVETPGESAVCFVQNQRDEVRLMGGDGEVAGSVCAMQATKQQNLIAYENHPQDGRVKETGEVSPSITAQAGTGGNNLPFVQSVDSKGVWRDDKSLPPCFHLNTRDELIPTEVPGALMATRNERMQSYIPIQEEHREDDDERE